jgi:DNA-binding winged helix-turn-helix (wHTH) protein
MMYLFDDYTLHTELYELRYAGAPCPLEPQVLDILLYLIQHRDRVVTREELLEHVWPERFISEATLDHRIMEARQAIGDSGQRQCRIKTLRGRGYRFVASVEERPVAGPQAGHAIAPQPQRLAMVLGCADFSMCAGRTPGLMARSPHAMDSSMMSTVKPSTSRCRAGGGRGGISRLGRGSRWGMVQAGARLLPSWQSILCAGGMPHGRCSICDTRGSKQCSVWRIRKRCRTSPGRWSCWPCSPRPRRGSSRNSTCR